MDYSNNIGDKSEGDNNRKPYVLHAPSRFLPFSLFPKRKTTRYTVNYGWWEKPIKNNKPAGTEDVSKCRAKWLEKGK